MYFLLFVLSFVVSTSIVNGLLRFERNVKIYSLTQTPVEVCWNKIILRPTYPYQLPLGKTVVVVRGLSRVLRPARHIIGHFGDDIVVVELWTGFCTIVHFKQAFNALFSYSCFM